MNDTIQKFKKLCYDDEWDSCVATRFSNGDLNKKIEIIKVFKEMIKEQFQKVGITKIIFRYDFNYWYNSFRGFFKHDNKLYFFIFNFWSKRIDIQAVEFLDDGKPYRSNRTKSYWINNDRLIPEKIFKLPKHRKFNVGDLVLYKNKYICKVDKIQILSKIYYELTALWEKHINGRTVSFRYITEYNLKSLEKGM